MFWNDIKDVKIRLDEIEDLLRDRMPFDNLKEDMDIILDKVNSLIIDSRRIERVKIAEQTLDKFDDYMKNVDKLNSMINEFKGCVSMARSALAERAVLEKNKSTSSQS
jgi:hypothetical protein